MSSTWPHGVSRTLDPQQRVERARNAALTRSTPEYLIRRLATHRLDAEQVGQLAEVLAVHVRSLVHTDVAARVQP